MYTPITVRSPAHCALTPERRHPMARIAHGHNHMQIEPNTMTKLEQQSSIQFAHAAVDARTRPRSCWLDLRPRSDRACLDKTRLLELTHLPSSCVCITSTSSGWLRLGSWVGGHFFLELLGFGSSQCRSSSAFPVLITPASKPGYFSRVGPRSHNRHRSDVPYQPHPPRTVYTIAALVCVEV